MRRLPIAIPLQASTAPIEGVPVVEHPPPGTLVPVPGGGYAPFVPAPVPQRQPAQEAVVVELRVSVPSDAAREIAEALRALVAAKSAEAPAVREGVWKRFLRALGG